MWRRDSLVQVRDRSLLPVARPGVQLHADGGAGSDRARERDRPAERVDPILEPDQARAAVGIGTAEAVVADLELDRSVALSTAHRNRRSLRVLDGVGDRLCDHVVDGRLERGVVPALEADVEVDLNLTSPCESPKSI